MASIPIDEEAPVASIVEDEDPPLIDIPIGEGAPLVDIPTVEPPKPPEIPFKIINAIMVAPVAKTVNTVKKMGTTPTSTSLVAVAMVEDGF